MDKAEFVAALLSPVLQHVVSVVEGRRTVSELGSAMATVSNEFVKGLEPTLDQLFPAGKGAAASFGSTADT